MQLNSLLKFGSLALDVAQDDKIKELVTMVHKGAKRRGLFGIQEPHAAASAGVTKAETKPKTELKPQTSQAKKARPHIPFEPEHEMPGGFSPGQFLTVENAKKMVDYAAIVKNVLMK